MFQQSWILVNLRWLYYPVDINRLHAASELILKLGPWLCMMSAGPLVFQPIVYCVFLNSYGIREIPTCTSNLMCIDLLTHQRPQLILHVRFSLDKYPDMTFLVVENNERAKVHFS